MEHKTFKVLLLNGSGHTKGCVARAFDELEKALNENGILTEWIQVGNKDIRGCIGCNYCRNHGKCVFNDLVNETAPKLAEPTVLLPEPLFTMVDRMGNSMHLWIGCSTVHRAP